MVWNKSGIYMARSTSLGMYAIADPAILSNLSETGTASATYQGLTTPSNDISLVRLSGEIPSY